MIGSYTIYTGAGGWFFRYLRKPEIGPFNIYGSRRLVLSIYTGPVVGSFNIYGSRRFVPSI